jgi:hypothetical protein
MNHATEFADNKARFALAAALRVGLGWWNQAAPGSHQRQEIAGLRHYIGDRLGANDWSPKTLNKVGVMFCLTCRKTHPGLSSICAGKPLLECVLIAEE